MLFAFRALFGIGMGGESAAGMPLPLEHCRVESTVNGVLAGSEATGTTEDSGLIPLVDTQVSSGSEVIARVG